MAVQRLDSVEQATEAGSAVELGAALAVVLDLDQRETTGAKDANRRLARTRVLHDVRQCLGGYVVSSCLDRLGQAFSQPHVEGDRQRCPGREHFERRLEGPVRRQLRLELFSFAIGSSFFPYYARMHRQWPLPVPVTAPTGYAAFPREILRPPRSLAERAYTDIRRWTVMPRGGHFAAMEQPDALAHEIREFFRPLRA